MALVIAMQLRRFHRWHALAMSVIVITSAGSGLIHTWMSTHQAPPPATRPVEAVNLAGATLPPAQLPAHLPVDAGQPVSASLRSLDGRPCWQVICSGRSAPLWLDAVTGQPDPGADERYAAGIAARAAGGHGVRQTAYLESYDSEYIAIFRLLPVYRFEVDDHYGTRLYVSTMTGSIARATDDRKQFEANVFSLFHKWTFIPWKGVRDWALIVAMASLILLATVGLVLFWTTRRRAHPIQQPEPS